jgi:hypothetical protein
LGVGIVIMTTEQLKKLIDALTFTSSKSFSHIYHIRDDIVKALNELLGYKRSVQDVDKK